MCRRGGIRDDGAPSACKATSSALLGRRNAVYHRIVRAAIVLTWQFPSPEVGAHSPGAITTALSFAGRAHAGVRAPFGLKDDWCCHCAAVVPATRTVTKLRPTPAVCRAARSHDANQLQSSCFLEKDTTLQREHLRQRRAQEARSSMPCSAADHMP